MPCILETLKINFHYVIKILKEFLSVLFLSARKSLNTALWRGLFLLIDTDKWNKNELMSFKLDKINISWWRNQITNKFSEFAPINTFQTDPQIDTN